MIHNVFAGNPGSGKSTIANTLIGEALFNAGISFGTGLTTVLDTKECDGEKYSDTPGLDDLNVREEAAAEISRALSEADHLRLVFVVTLEDGRVRPADLVTVETILEAVSKAHVDVNNGFSLIVNKCNDGELAALESDERTRKMVIQAFACGKQLSHVYFAPRCGDAEGRENALLPLRERLQEFMRDAPVLQMPGTPITVDLSRYQMRLDELMREVADLRVRMRGLQQDSESENRTTMLKQLVSSVAFALAYGALKKALPIALRSLL